MTVCVQHEQNSEEHAPKCLWCELDRVKALLRRCAVELTYVQAVEHCNTGMCATPVGQECIEDAEQELGEMCHWPEVVG